MDCSRPFSYVALQTIEKLGLVAEINERNLQKCCNVQNLPKIAKRDVKLEKRRGGLELQNQVGNFQPVLNLSNWAGAHTI